MKMDVGSLIHMASHVTQMINFQGTPRISLFILSAVNVKYFFLCIYSLACIEA